MDIFLNDTGPLFDKKAQEMFENFETFSRVSPYICSLTICIILVTGLIGNALVIYITLTTQRVIKHPVHSMLVLNLAVADIVYLITSGPYQALAYSYPGWIFGSFLCPALHYFNIATMSVSIFTMCALAWMRFMALMIPFRFQRSFLSTRKAGFGVVVAVWVFAAGLSTPTAVHFRVESFNNGTAMENVAVGCVWQDATSKEAYAVAVLVVTYVIPFLLVTIFYFFVGREIFCYMRNKARSKCDSNGGKSEQAEFTRTTIMVLCLIVAFLICWFPHHLGKMMIVSKNYEGFEYAVMMAALELTGYCMSYFHACVNPIIYTFAAPGFRRSLRKTIATDRCDFDSLLSLLRSRKRKKQKIQKKTRETTTAPTNNERTCISRLASPILPDRKSSSNQQEVKALVSGHFLTVDDNTCKKV